MKIEICRVKEIEKENAEKRKVNRKQYLYVAVELGVTGTHIAV